MKVQSRGLISKRLIGNGSSSIVYETTWNGESYARKDFLGVPEDIFEAEAKALVDLDAHPNVVQTYCWTVDEESCSLVIELMDDDLLNLLQRRQASQQKKLNPGSSWSGAPSQTIIDLQKFIEDHSQIAPVAVTTSSESAVSPPIYSFSMPEALQIIVQITEGMEFLHDKGVVHGSLKPKNVLVKSSGFNSLDEMSEINFKVSDFGLMGATAGSKTFVSRRACELETVRWIVPELFSNLSFNSTGDENDSSTDSDWDPDSSEGESSVHYDVVPTTYSDVYSFALTCWSVNTMGL